MSCPFDASETEDTTLCFVASCADLTAYVSAQSFSKYKADDFGHPSTLALSALSLPVYDLRISAPLLSEGVSVFKLSSTDEVPLDTVPSIPSAVSYWGCIRSLASVQIRPHFLDSHDVVGLLGSGTCGQVVLASSKESGDLHAVKILRKVDNGDLARELSTLELIRECSSMKGVSFLQRFQETFQDEDCVQYLVMEYHPLTLSDPEVTSHFRLMPNNRPGLFTSTSLPINLVRPRNPTHSQDEIIHFVRLLVAEISLGLAFLHERGLVHQDVKPANILISYAGHVVVGDFGATSKMPLTSETHDTSESSSIVRGTQYGPIVLQADDLVTFTPLYAAPELRERTPEGLIVYDDRSDWWSLGILLYELVTGSVPFQPVSGSVTPPGGGGGRRSDGDRSLTFGELEELSDRLKAGKNTWYITLESFVRLLLSENPDDRLSWPDIQDHEFLSSLRDIWNDIVELKYPPYPSVNPSTSAVDIHACVAITDAGLISSSVQDIHVYERSGVDLIHEASFDACGATLFISSSLPTTWKQLPNPQEEESYDESIPQALPSSASIWVFGCTHDTDVHCNSEFDFRFNTLSSSKSDASRDYIKYNPQPSFSSTPVFDQRCRTGTSTYSLSCFEPPRRECSSLTFSAEDITLSLLEAMDVRDRDRVVWERGQNPSVRKSSIARRIFRKIFSW